MKRRGGTARHGGPGAAKPAMGAAPAAGGRGRGRPERVALAWARDRDGKLTPVTALDETSRRARAPFTCPGCGDALVVRLGQVRARHFAHRPGSACPLTAPETALHFNAKERLLALCGEAFAGARRVTLLTRCRTCRRLDTRELAALGDGAAAEGAVGALRADVLVTQGGRPALAIEVLVTHAVDAEKEAALETAGVPAVEVDAREAWEQEGAGGAVEVVCDRTLGFPPCANCRTAARADEDRALGGEAAQIAELEAYRARGLLGERVREPVTRVKSATSQATTDHDPESWAATPTNDSGSFDANAPFSDAERAALAGRFRCPLCGASSLLWGTRLVRHACPNEPPRPVAWRGYDGRPTELGWWKR
ncbi:MAG TPA: competence protein CoiA family protein [Anaeromyxobacteraceae bacterium]|nr:competence protein CoiA family protein [Anaeromyxobacteraceae bacterium]